MVILIDGGGTFRQQTIGAGDGTLQTVTRMLERLLLCVVVVVERFFICTAGTATNQCVILEQFCHGENLLLFENLIYGAIPLLDFPIFRVIPHARLGKKTCRDLTPPTPIRGQA